MKHCPVCNRTFEDTQSFCASDGTPLVSDTPSPSGSFEKAAPLPPTGGAGPTYRSESSGQEWAGYRPAQPPTPSSNAPNADAFNAPAAQTGKTSTGLEPNIAGLLSYVLGWVTGLIFFLIEKENRFVRFHAMQSIVFGVALTIIFIGFSVFGTMLALLHLGLLNLLLYPVEFILLLGAFVIWLLCMFKAFQGQMYKLPVLGKVAEDMVNKQS